MRKRVLAILSGVAIVASTLALMPDEAAARFGGGGGGFRGGGGFGGGGGFRSGGFGGGGGMPGGGFRGGFAGGGFRGGLAYGSTDEMGMAAVEHPLDIHDIHATILHALGIDHTRLTFRFGGRDVRLTDVHGRVIADLLV